jgi:cytochrome c oxidase subunit 4
MPGHALISVRTYTLVCIVLVALTALTVSVSLLPLEGGWHLAAGLSIGLGKATLVVVFFMHALHSSRMTWVVIAAACFWLGLLFVLTLADYITRRQVKPSDIARPSLPYPSPHYAPTKMPP